MDLASARTGRDGNRFWGSGLGFNSSCFDSKFLSFDEIRDALENSVGPGTFGQNWQMCVLTLTGIALLWKARWKNLSPE
jgi:hypothetical protein